MSLRIIWHEKGQHCINEDAQPGLKKSGPRDQVSIFNAGRFVQVGYTNSPTLIIEDSNFLRESRTHLWNFIFQALPEVATVNGLAHVSEDGVLLEGPHGIGVCLHVCSWGNTEESGFRVDATQLSFVIEAHPRNVIAWETQQNTYNFFVYFLTWKWQHSSNRVFTSKFLNYSQVSKHGA